MRRIRQAVPGILWASLVLCGMATTLAAADPMVVTQHEMRSFVYETLALSSAAVIGGGAGLMAWILGRDRSLRAENLAQLTTAVSELGAGLHAAIRTLQEHNDSPYAHVAASEHNHAPMQAQLDRMETEIEKILRDCAARTCSPRNPSDSPHAKRFSDPPEFDGRPMRGKA